MISSVVRIAAMFVMFLYIPKGHWSEGQLVRRAIGPNLTFFNMGPHGVKTSKHYSSHTS